MSRAREWDGGGIRKRRVKLGENQVRRHKILAWYHANWKKELDWQKFIEENTSEFTMLFPVNKIAPSGSILERDLNEVLSLINRKPLENILMYFHSDNPQEIREKYDEMKFTKLLIQYDKRHNQVEMDY